MESVLKKYQQKFKKARDDMSRWDELQSLLLSQFKNASSIIERLQVIEDAKSYGTLNCIVGISNAVLRKQMVSLQTILLSMNKTLDEFHGIVSALEKLLHDGRQLVKGGSSQSMGKLLQQRVGIKPTLSDCLEGLKLLHEMHDSEIANRRTREEHSEELLEAMQPPDLCSFINFQTAGTIENNSNEYFGAASIMISGFHPCRMLVLLVKNYLNRYHLKKSLVSALTTVILKASASDLAALQQLLVDQPNIARDEVRYIFDVVFAEEMC